MKNPKLVLAPMLKVTDPYFRTLISIISPKTVLFTEMIVANTAIHAGDLIYKLGSTKNTTVQIGGSDPEQICKAVEIIKTYGFTSFNLNCGCPSTKVKKGCFGAILMTMPDTVIDIINTVYNKTGVIISIKCRIGVDNNDSFDFFQGFIDKIVKNTKCRDFYVHCRKCLLNGISPKENRTVPPLDYSFAVKIKEMYDDVNIYINGGIKKYEDMVYDVDGYMIGREAISNPFVFAQIERSFIASKNIGYIEELETSCSMDNRCKDDCVETKLIDEDIGKKVDWNCEDTYTRRNDDRIDGRDTRPSIMCQNSDYTERVTWFSREENKKAHMDPQDQLPSKYKVTKVNVLNVGCSEKQIQIPVVSRNDDLSGSLLSQNHDCSTKQMKLNFDCVIDDCLIKNDMNIVEDVILQYINRYSENVTSRLVNPIMQLLKGHKNGKAYKKLLCNAAKSKIATNELSANLESFFVNSKLR